MVLLDESEGKAFCLVRGTDIRTLVAVSIASILSHIEVCDNLYTEAHV